MPSPNDVVARGLGGAVRTPGIVGGVFGKEALRAQGAIDFIGGDVVKALAFEPAFGIRPGAACGGQHGGRAHDVGFQKSHRSGDAAVHVAFRGEVHHRIDFFLPHQGRDPLRIADVHFDEAVVGRPFKVLEVGQLPA